MRQRRAALLLVGLAGALVLGACTDPESVGDARERAEERGDDGTTTPTIGGAQVDPNDVEVEVPSGGHHYEVTEFGVEGDVESTERYRNSGTDGEFVIDAIVVDGTAYVRQGTANTIETLQYDEMPLDEFTAAGALERLQALAESGVEIFADEAAAAVFNVVLELATIDPAAFVEQLLASDDVQAGRNGDGAILSTPRFTVPGAEGLDAIVEGVPAISAEAFLDDEGLLTAIQVEIAVGADPLQVSIEFEFGPVDPVNEPPPELLAPLVDEEALAAFTDTPLVAPAQPPAGLSLRRVRVLTSEETLEGCPQVELTYTDDSGLDNLVLYLLPQDCAVAFDPATPFDQTFGGLPSRFEGTEVLHGTTVVQLTGTLRQAEYEAVAASLLPTTPEALAAAVVPLPD